MSGRGPIRVLLANDVELVLKGLEALLAPFADRVTVVGTVMGDPDISIDAPLPEQVRRGAQIFLEILRPHLVPGVYALLHGVISAWKPAKKSAGKTGASKARD